MVPSMKKCYVLLDRNFPGMDEAIKKVDYPRVEIEYCGEAYRSKITKPIASPRIHKKNCSKLRNKELINYSENMKNSESDDSSDDNGAAQERETERQKSLSKTPNKLICLLCKQSFNNHKAYLIHHRSHKSTPFKCILCRKGFKERQFFINHMKMFHPEVDPFVCEYPRCELSFKTQRNLESHHKAHWKYMCKYCKKSFVRKHQMRNHVLKIH